MRNLIAGGLKTALLATAFAAVCTAPSMAAGVPSTTVDPALAPPGLAVDGHLQVVFTFTDASNEDLILSIPALAANPIIDNHVTPVGTQVDLGNYTGNVVFELDNLRTLSTYFSDSLDGDGNYHVLLDANYADFGVGALSGTALTNVTNLQNAGYSIVFMAWEDHDIHSYIPSDWDYNDVIFALAYKVNERSVPEPLTLSLFGAGLAGAGALRWRRKASKKA